MLGTKTTKRALPMLLALILAAGLFGCSSRPAEPAAPTPIPTPTPVPTPVPTPAPEGAVEPQELNWGMGGEDKTEPDLWVPVKGEETRSLYFTPGEGEILCTVTWVDESERNTGVPCVAEGMHLKTIRDAAVEADFVFPDRFTAFDRETDTTYSRGDYEALAAKIAGRTFVSQADETRTYTFGADFSVTEVYREQEYPGIWLLDTPTVLSCIFDDDPGYAYRYEIIFDDGGMVTELYMGDSNRFSPAE